MRWDGDGVRLSGRSPDRLTADGGGHGRFSELVSKLAGVTAGGW